VDSLLCLTLCARPSTAKHNLRCAQVVVGDDPSTLYKPTTTKLRLTDLALADLDTAVSWSDDDFGWQPTETDIFNLRPGEELTRPSFCKFGLFDMSIGNVIADPHFIAYAAQSSFERVRKDFTLEKGQRVGMAVLFTKRTGPTRSTIVGVGTRGFDNVCHE
jgi:hypothetical protein